MANGLFMLDSFFMMLDHIESCECYPYRTAQVRAKIATIDRPEEKCDSQEDFDALCDFLHEKSNSHPDNHVVFKVAVAGKSFYIGVSDCRLTFGLDVEVRSW